MAFVRKAERHRDELLYWLAGGAGLATFARVNHVLFPSLYSNWVYTGDILRLAAYSSTWPLPPARSPRTSRAGPRWRR